MENKTYWTTKVGDNHTVAYSLRKKAISTLTVGGENAMWHIDVDKKFNWFQKKMLKWCFGFEVNDNNKEG